MALLGASGTLFALSATLYRLWRLASRELGFPPGPPTLPVLGNLLMLPTKDVHLKWVSFLRTVHCANGISVV